MLDQLDALANAVPELNKRAEQKAKASAAVQLQASLKQQPLPKGVNATVGAQTIAPQAQLQQAAISQNANKENQQQLSQVAGTAIEAKAADNRNVLAGQEMAAEAELTRADRAQAVNLVKQQLEARKLITEQDLDSKEALQKYGIEMDLRLNLATLKQREDLSKLGNDLKGKLLDSRLMFQRAEGKRQFTNERQMADYIASNARNELDFQQKMRDMAEASDRAIYLMKQSSQAITQSLNQGFIEKEGDLDFAQQRKLLKIQQKLEKEIARKQAEARNRSSVITGVFTVGGAVVGGIIGGAAGGAGAAPGAMMGASIGAGAGTVVSGVVSQHSD